MIGLDKHDHLYLLQPLLANPTGKLPLGLLWRVEQPVVRYMHLVSAQMVLLLIVHGVL